MITKINYHPTKLKYLIAFGTFWLCLGVAFIFYSTTNWQSYSHIILSAIVFLIYIYSKRSGYLSIKEGFIYKNGLIKKNIKISNIKKIQKYKGKYILSTEASNFEINTYLLDAPGLEMLNQFLKDSANL